LGGYSKPLIATDQQTIGSVLQAAGYHTGCVGKWHLGLGWQWKAKSPNNINNFGIAGERGMVDYAQPITDGPTHHGFDESYIIPASLDMSPYVYIKNDRVTEIPEKVIDGVNFPKFFRKGEISSDFKHVDCLSHLMEKANEFIREQAKTDKPFFLYFPMPAPHKPVIPMQDFEGKTELGSYGDFVAQVDWTVGEVMKTLDEAGVEDDTLLIVTSDNGSFMHRYDDEETKDHLDDEKVQGYRAANHQPNGKLRGTKADVYEAGHRVPFFVRWPNKTRSNDSSDKTICHTDILATAAEVAGATFDTPNSEDSFSFLQSALSSPTRELTPRPMVINHSANGMFAIRHYQFKLIFGDGSGGRQKPRGQAFKKPYQLYNLEEDLGEAKNMLDENPNTVHKADLVEIMTNKFEELAHGDQISPPKKKPNKKKN
jgi:arylsulfatase A-like enzyme